jgi:hypothetical protein
LSAGLAAVDGISEHETPMIAQLLNRGWAVSVPDYEGPNSQFLGARGEADGVLDGIRAALAFKPAGLSKATPIGVWGYSGGGLASSEAAQAQPTYAPRLHLSGVALGGVVANLYSTFMAFDRPPFGGGTIVGLVGIDRSYPKANLEQYLNAAGKRDAAAAQNYCLTDGILAFPLLTSATVEAVPGDFKLPAVINWLERISPLYLPGTPRAPIYDYHAVGDELAPVGPDRQLMARYCAAGVKVQHVEDRIGEHLTEEELGGAGAIKYLAARFAGVPAPSTCPA